MRQSGNAVVSRLRYGAMLLFSRNWPILPPARALDQSGQFAGEDGIAITLRIRDCKIAEARGLPLFRVSLCVPRG
jgi:hypothetical protein